MELLKNDGILSNQQITKVFPDYNSSDKLWRAMTERVRDFSMDAKHCVLGVSKSSLYQLRKGPTLLMVNSAQVTR